MTDARLALNRIEATYDHWAAFNDGTLNPEDFGAESVTFVLAAEDGTSLYNEYRPGQTPRIYTDDDSKPGEVMDIPNPVRSVNVVRAPAYTAPVPTIDAGSPCTAEITTAGDDRPAPGGGLIVTLNVPTYNGMCSLTLMSERDADGDWRVYLPSVDGYDVQNGIMYLGAPDVERPAARGPADY